MRRIGIKSLILMLFSALFFGVYVFAFEKIKVWVAYNHQKLNFDYSDWYTGSTKFLCSSDVSQLINLLLGCSIGLFVAQFVCVIILKKKMDLFPITVAFMSFYPLSTSVMQIFPCDMVTKNRSDINSLMIWITVLGVLLLVTNILLLLSYYIKIHTGILKTVLWVDILSQLAFFVYKAVYVGLFLADFSVKVRYEVIMMIVAQIAILLFLIFWLCAMYVFVPSFHKTAKELEEKSSAKNDAAYTEASLRRFKQLYEDGVITEEEYLVKKEEILSRLV